MNDGILYLDSSALIKLIFEEEESRELVEFLAEWPTRASSALARVEVLRTARLVEDDLVIRDAQQVLARVHLIKPDDVLLATAVRAEPMTLRALDAVHLATALSLGSELAGMVVYDRRLAAAARSAGVSVFAPA